jgi:small nuclear ribonucleoprotein E
MSNKLTVPPISQIYKWLTGKCLVEIWTFDRPNSRFQGIIRGFDEYMNVVLDQTVEVQIKKDLKRSLGRIMLKGDTITLVRQII